MQTFSKKFLAILLTLCMLASFTPMAVFAAEAEVVGQQLMLGDDLVMHFYTKVENAANATAAISVGGTQRAAYTLSELTAGENGYDLSVHMAAAEMTEEISLVVSDGETQLLQKTYSVKAYAQYLLDGNYTDETKALAKEMLNYGAKAQLYFGINSDDLANAGNEIETSAVIGTDVPVVEVDDSLSGLNYYGASMLFRSKIAVRFYFSGSVAGLTFQVGENTYTPAEKGGMYYIEVADINPDQMDTALAVSVSDGSSSLSFSYSPADYITRMYNKSSSSAELKAMLLAVKGYFDAAKVFTGVAENRTGSLSLQYRYGASNLIQVNTDLPSDTPCVNFTASDNGSSIDQSANEYQQFGWVGMDNVEGTIVLTFHFNNAFEVGQSYTLSAGSVFGFTDGSKYELKSDITLYWDGANWVDEAPVVETPTLTFLNCSYGTSKLIQLKTDLPTSTPCASFLVTDNGCQIDQSGNKYQQVGWMGMATDADGNIYISFNFNNDFSAGQTYVLPKGAVFGFTDGSAYVLDKNYTFTFDGNSWTITTQEDPITLTYRYGTSNLIQYNTDLPATTPLANFLASDNGCALIQNGQSVGWIQMADADGTVVLTFHFNTAFEAGQSYTLSAGSVFGFTDGSKYDLYEDVTLYWNGEGWSVDAPVEEEQNITLAYRYGAANLIQFNTDLPATTPCVSFTAADNGCSLNQNANQYQQVGWIGMDNVDGTIVLTFHFNGTFEAGQSYIIPAGSVFGFTDGSSYTLAEEMILYYNGNSWETTAAITLSYRYGTSNLIQVNTNLPASTPIANFLASDNGCALIQNGQNVGWIQMADADGTIVLTFHFNTAFTYGQSYGLSAGSVFGFADGTSYKLYQDVTLYWDDSQWTAEEPAAQMDVLDEVNF